MRGRGVIDGPFLNFSTQGLASFLKFRQFKGKIFLSVEFLKPEPGVYPGEIIARVYYRVFERLTDMVSFLWPKLAFDERTTMEPSLSIECCPRLLNHVVVAGCGSGKRKSIHRLRLAAAR